MVRTYKQIQRWENQRRRRAERHLEDMTDDQRAVWQEHGCQGKVRYPSGAVANEAASAQRQAQDKRRNLRAYPCPFCGFWHLGNNRHELKLLNKRQRRKITPAPVPPQEQDTGPKLTEAQRQEIRTLYEAGVCGYKTLARRYGVNRTTIRALVRPDDAKEMGNEPAPRANPLPNQEETGTAGAGTREHTHTSV